jgi:hypothetical protein
MKWLLIITYVAVFAFLIGAVVGFVSEAHDVIDKCSRTGEWEWIERYPWAAEHVVKIYCSNIYDSQAKSAAEPK